MLKDLQANDKKPQLYRKPRADVFTVLLVMEGTVIVEAAPIVKRFEGQTIGALTSWAQSRFGGPIVVEELRRFRQGNTRTTIAYPPKDGGHAQNS